MAGNLNEVMLIGNLCADVELRRTRDGRPVANFTLATSERWKTRDGQWRERTEFHRCVCFNEGLCRLLSSHGRKGTKLFLRGKLQNRRWQDAQGNERSAAEIFLQGFDARLVLLDGRPRRYDEYDEDGPEPGDGEPQADGDENPFEDEETLEAAD